MTNKEDHPVDRSLLSPVIYRFLPKDSKINGTLRYSSVEKELQVDPISTKPKENGLETIDTTT